MASISQLTQVSCPVSLSQPQFSPKSSVFAIKSIGSAAKSVQKRSISGSGIGSVRSVSRVRAAEGEEAVPEKEEAEKEKEKEEEAEANKPVAVAEKPKNPSAMDNLKKSLVDAFKGTDRGLLANSETRAKIVELINQLEAKNKVPKDALPLLNGKWILAYTNFAGLFPLLSAGALPLVEVSELSQTIDSENLAVQNSVKLSGPLSSTSLSTNAKFEVQSPKRLQIKYEEGVIRTPQLTESIVFPEYLEILGQKIDLAPLKGILTSVQEASPLKIPIPGDTSQSWLLTTYLDEELRISRGDAGTVFVLVKEGTYFLAP